MEIDVFKNKMRQEHVFCLFVFDIYRKLCWEELKYGKFWGKLLYSNR